MVYYSRPHEWRTSKQIASFFYILSKSQRAKSVEGGTESFDSEDEEPINQDKPLQALQLILETQVQADHPILFQGHNFCQLTEQGNLGKPPARCIKESLFRVSAGNYWGKNKEGYVCCRSTQIHRNPPLKEL